jgi:hypothetical protein
MYRSKRKAVFISSETASGEQSDKSLNTAREISSGVAGATCADAVDVEWQPASFGLKQNAEVVTSPVQLLPSEKNATIDGGDSKLMQEFQKVDLGSRCVSICDELGIQTYHDLQWVNTDMVSKYKPVEREKFKALLGNYQRCKESGVVAGADGKRGEEVLKAAVGASADGKRGEEVLKAAVGAVADGKRGEEVLKAAVGAVADGKGGEKAPKDNQEAVDAGGGESCSETRNQSEGQASASPPAMKTHVARSYKKCKECGSPGHSMTLDDAVEFLVLKRKHNYRQTYKQLFMHMAKPRLTTDQINTLPYDDIKNAVAKETASFILRISKEDVIGFRKQGFDVTCLFECRKCNQNGAPRYMCDRVRSGPDGEYFSQRDNGFATDVCVRYQFRDLLRKLNTAAGLMQIAN